MSAQDGPPPLTEEQAHWARRQFARWLKIKEVHERARYKPGEADARKWKVGELSHLVIDADHSGLLVHLLTGGDPLPEPPPLEYGYPVYPPGDHARDLRPGDWIECLDGTEDRVMEVEHDHGERVNVYFKYAGRYLYDPTDRIVRAGRSGDGGG